MKDSSVCVVHIWTQKYDLDKQEAFFFISVIVKKNVEGNNCRRLI